MKTPAEINSLKSNWTNDPCWDIETTDGFEDHREELLAFRLESERRWKQRQDAHLQRKADEIGCPGNTMLAAYVEGLERQIAELREALSERREDRP